MNEDQSYARYLKAYTITRSGTHLSSGPDETDFAAAMALGAHDGRQNIAPKTRPEFLAQMKTVLAAA